MSYERSPDEGKEKPESDGMDGVKEAAKELIAAVHAKDESAVAMALKNAFEILDSMPHEEGPHPEDDDQE